MNYTPEQDLRARIHLLLLGLTEDALRAILACLEARRCYPGGKAEDPMRSSER